MKLAALFLLLFLGNICNAQTTKEKQLHAFILKCTKAFSFMDSGMANKLIDKKEGFYIIHRSGVFTNYKKVNSIDFYAEYPSVLLAQTEGIETPKIKKEAIPTFDCEKEKWNKTGAFYNPKIGVKTLSNLCQNRNKYVPDNIPQTTINRFINMEKRSVEVYIINSKAHAIFIVTYTNNRWVLTGINMAEGDCSA